MAQDERFPVKLFPTATATDVLFYVIMGRLDKRKIPEYGTPYNDITPRVEDWPDHRLVYVSPSDGDGRQKWFFAADRENEDVYNWSIGQGEELNRGYLVLRENYYGRSAAEAVGFGTKFIQGGPFANTDGPVVFGPFYYRQVVNGKPSFNNHPPDYSDIIIGSEDVVQWTGSVWEIKKGNPTFGYVFRAYSAEPVAYPHLVTAWTTDTSGVYSGSTGTVTGMTTVALADEFTHPIVPTLDSRFPKYGFADDTVLEAPDELRSLYIVVKRRFIEPETVEYSYNERLKKQIKITRTLIPAGSNQPPPASIPGTTYEVQNGNVFHDVLIKQEVALDGSTYPYSLETIPSTYDRRFPSRLDSVGIVWAVAYASSVGNPDSYSEDFFFKFKITDPKPGPYQASVLRFITNNPAGLQATYPTLVVPTPVTETIAAARAWFYASTDGNNTYAAAKEWSVPETIHDEITLDFDGDTADVAGIGAVAGGTEGSYNTGTLGETSGYSTFVALSTVTVDFNVSDAPLGLFEVSVVQINISGLYS